MEVPQDPATHKIRASLSFSKMKASICTPKMMADVAMAPSRATRLMPWELWPWPTAEEVVADGAEEVVEDMMET